MDMTLAPIALAREDAAEQAKIENAIARGEAATFVVRGSYKLVFNPESEELCIYPATFNPRPKVFSSALPYDSILEYLNGNDGALGEGRRFL